MLILFKKCCIVNSGKNFLKTWWMTSKKHIIFVGKIVQWKWRMNEAKTVDIWWQSFWSKHHSVPARMRLFGGKGGKESRKPAYHHWDLELISSNFLGHISAVSKTILTIERRFTRSNDQIIFHPEIRKCVQICHWTFAPFTFFSNVTVCNKQSEIVCKIHGN